MEGQLLPEERAALNSAVRVRKPLTVLEVGTWKGGGSTWQIANALRNNFEENKVRGHLHTCEIAEVLYQEARQIYQNSDWQPFVSCHHTDSTSLIRQLQADQVDIDFTFFDGSELPELHFEDFRLLESRLKPGSVFTMHDWDSGDNPAQPTSIKAKLVRPYLERSPDWKIVAQLTAPISVGLVFALKVR